MTTMNIQRFDPSADRVRTSVMLVAKRMQMERKKGRHISLYTKERIVILSKKYSKITRIVDLINDEDPRNPVTRQSVSRIIKKYLARFTLRDLEKSGRPSIWTLEHYKFIDATMYQDDECTAYDMQLLLLRKFGIEFSLTNIRQKRERLGWVCTGPRYCQLIREPNKIKRLEFAKMLIETNDTFDDVIFTDESQIQLCRTGRICFRKKGELPRLKPKPKHPYKVYVWAGISKRGATNICIFQGIMRADFFTYTVLKEYLIPFIRKVYPDGHRFQQDNDPKHTSNIAKQFLLKNNIYHWKTPAESPDLNPIEMFWNELKYHLRKRVKPSNKEELVAGIQDFWKGVTWQRCEKYINHIHKVLPIIVERDGKASGH